MVESPEGMNGRVWSVQRDPDGTLHIMQGAHKLATLTQAGADVLHLFVTAPQLWSAANEMCRAAVTNAATQDECAQALNALGDMVAKAVNKPHYAAVAQAE